MASIQNILLSSSNLNQNFVSTCFSSVDTNATKCKVLFIAHSPVNAPATTLDNKVYVVNNLRDAEALFGTKNAAYESIFYGLQACNNKAAQLNVILLPNTAGAVASVDALTISGAATVAITKTVTIDNVTRYVEIPNGASIATQATLIKNAFDNVKQFPYTIAVTATGLTFTHNDAGIVGNNLVMSVTDSRDPMPVTDTVYTLANTTVGAGALDFTAFDAGNCCYNCVFTTDESLGTINSIQDYNDKKLDCFGVSCFQSLFWASKRSVATALAFGNGIVGTNDPYNRPNVGLLLPTTDVRNAYTVAAVRAMQSCCAGCSNPANPLQGDASVMPMFATSNGCETLFSNTDYNDLWAAGWTPVTSVNGYLGLNRERFFYRFDEEGNDTVSFSDPTQYRILSYLNNELIKTLTAKYGSINIFTNGTDIPNFNSNALVGTAPDWLQTINQGVTPQMVLTTVITFLQNFEGVLLDRQDWSKVASFFDDTVVKGLCNGDSKVWYLVIGKMRITRPIQKINAILGFTSRTC